MYSNEASRDWYVIPTAGGSCTLTLLDPLTLQKLQVNREYRDKIRQEVYFAIKFGIANHMNRVQGLPDWIKTPFHYARHLYGKVGYVLQINPKDTTFIKYRDWLKETMKNM